MVMAILVLRGIVFILDFLFDTLFDFDFVPALQTCVRYCKIVLTVVVTFYVCRLDLFLFEKRPAYELSFSSFLPEISTGFIPGGGMITLSAIILIIPDYYKINGFNSITALTDGMFLFIDGPFSRRYFSGLLFLSLWKNFWEVGFQ